MSLISIVMRCLEKDPAKRYQSVLELQKEIGAFLKMNYTNSLNESLLTKIMGSPQTTVLTSCWST